MNILFLLDENMPFTLMEFLSKKGYEVNHLKKMGKGGVKNGEVYTLAEEESARILTRDADFKSYYKFLKYNVEGIIVFTMEDTKTKNILRVVDRFLQDHGEQLTSKRLIIIEDTGMKIYNG